jgi:hypothetical protein
VDGGLAWDTSVAVTGEAGIAVGSAIVDSAVGVVVAQPARMAATAVESITSLPERALPCVMLTS